MTALRTQLGRCLPLLLLGGLTGCFGAKYEAQLQETGRWYAFLDEQDRFLGPPWADGNVSYFRPPAGFKAQFDVEAESEEPVPLEPDFLESPMEGLRATWTQPVKVSGADKTAYLLLLDNYDIWLNGRKAVPHPALGFLDRFGRSFPRRFNVLSETSETTDRSLPESGRFGPRRSFKVTTTELGELIDGLPYVARHATYDGGDVKGVLVLLYPRDVTGKEALDKAYDLAVESLEFHAAAPVKGAKKTTGGGTPDF